MKTIGDIDRNLAVTGVLTDTDIEWRSVREAPIAIHGLYHPYEAGPFRRVPADVAAATARVAAKAVAAVASKNGTQSEYTT